MPSKVEYIKRRSTRLYVPGLDSLYHTRALIIGKPFDMQVTTLFANALSITAYAAAAPAVAADPPELKGLWQGLRDFRCQTGGIDTFAVLTPDVGKCLKFKNKDTAGIKLNFVKENCDCESRSACLKALLKLTINSVGIY